MKVWVLVDFQTSEHYYKGSLVDLPDDEVGSLITYGIVSPNKPDGVIT